MGGRKSIDRGHLFAVQVDCRDSTVATDITNELHSCPMKFRAHGGACSGTYRNCALLPSRQISKINIAIPRVIAKALPSLSAVLQPRAAIVGNRELTSPDGIFDGFVSYLRISDGFIVGGVAISIQREE